LGNDGKMDVKFINAFLDGTVNVIKTMAFVDPQAGTSYVKRTVWLPGMFPASSY